MAVQCIRRTLCLWIFSMMCNDLVSSDCSTGLTSQFQSAIDDEQFIESWGCTNGCPPKAPEVHVIAQIRQNPAVEKVFVTINNKCNTSVAVSLVLISQEPIHWLLDSQSFDYISEEEYTSKEDERDPKIHFLDTQVYQTTPLTSGSSLAESVGSFGQVNIRESKLLNLDMTNEPLRKWVINNYTVVKSIRFAIRPSDWELNIGEGCCQSIVSPNQPVDRSNPEEGTSQPQRIAIIVAIVVVAVILISAILIGTYCYYSRHQKQKGAGKSRESAAANRGLSSLESRPAAEPNEYNAPPGVRPSAPHLQLNAE